MGTRNADRIPLVMWRSRAETVEGMHRLGIEVVSKCQSCDLMMRVDLAMVTQLSGPTTSLWCRKPRCRRLGCTGRVQFMAMFPGFGW